VNTREFRERLQRRARRAGVRVPVELATRLEVYYRLLATWNQKVKLTALNLKDATDEAFDRLLIEPLVAATHAPTGSGRMMDIGSGGGSPALPFALAVPHLTLLMVESKTRKSVFLREAIRALELGGAEVVTARFEELLSRPDLHEAHELVTVRAVRVEARVLLGLQAFIRPGGLLFLFRGPASSDPATVAPPPLVWEATYPLVDALRSRLVVLSKRAEGGVPRETIAL
jgi:16S rRNA (guanine527-N7)-methyltransferase